jgi:GntR family transcriptional regulator
MSHDSAPLATADTGPDLPVPGRGSTPPLHERIAEALRVAIARGVYPPGSKLPTEAELSSLHGAGRGTIRAALQAVEAEGLVSARRGSGRVVLDVGVSQSFDELRSFAQWARAAGRSPGGRFVTRVLRKPEPAEAAALQVDADSDVLYTIRLRTLDGAPVFVERCTYPGWIAGTIARLDVNCASVTAEVRRRTGTIAVTGTHTLDLARADAVDAELLGCRAGDPVLRRRAITRRADGVPCDYTDDHYAEGAALFTLHNSVTTNVLSRFLRT